MKRRNLDDIEFTSVEENSSKEKLKKGTFEENGNVYDPYAMSKSSKLPVWLKACFTKWWVAGMVWYFLYFGTGYNPDYELFALICGLALGAITDVFVNGAFRQFSSEGNDYRKFMFSGRQKSFATIFINILYYIVVCLIVVELMNLFLYLIDTANPSANYDEILFYAGAFVFAFMVLGFDMLFTFIRNVIEKVVKKLKKKDENNDK